MGSTRPPDELEPLIVDVQDGAGVLGQQQRHLDVVADEAVEPVVHTRPDGVVCGRTGLLHGAHGAERKDELHRAKTDSRCRPARRSLSKTTFSFGCQVLGGLPAARTLSTRRHPSWNISRFRAGRSWPMAFPLKPGVTLPVCSAACCERRSCAAFRSSFWSDATTASEASVEAATTVCVAYLRGEGR